MYKNTKKSGKSKGNTNNIENKIKYKKGGNQQHKNRIDFTDFPFSVFKQMKQKNNPLEKERKVFVSLDCCCGRSSE